MQQEKGAGGEEMMMNPQQQDLRIKQGDNQTQQQQPAQKCPRCDSLNTKFCYYNNYSLSQPRYFCKTCRRYWTQGGTLRNVPVGGGCRKGKRAKTAGSSSYSVGSGESSLGMTAQSTQQTQTPVLTQQTMIPSNPAFITGNLGLTTSKDHGQIGSNNLPTASEISSMVSYYQGGGGFLSSLSGINQPANVLPGNLQSFGSNQFFQMTNRPEKSAINPIYPTDHGSLIQSSRLHDHQQQQNWHRRLINNTANDPTVDSEVWRMSINGGNVSSTSTGNRTNTSNVSTVGFPASFNPSQWPDHHDDHLPGYYPPP